MTKQLKSRRRTKKGPGRMPFSRTPKKCDPYQWWVRKGEQP